MELRTNRVRINRARPVYEETITVTIDKINKTDKILVSFSERLWIPDVFLRNEKDTNSLHMEEITDSNTLARVNASGSIWYVRELTSKFRCSMNLQHYPMGTFENHI